MFTTIDKALVGGVVGLVSAIVLMATGAGEGPTPDQINEVGSQVGLFVTALVVGGIQGFLVWAFPNREA